MRKIELLKQEALKSCAHRNHEMRRFQKHPWRKNISTSECRHCGMTVVVNSKPMPNEIDIMGEAVALHCDNPL